MSQAAAAATLNVSVRTLQSWEYGILGGGWNPRRIQRVADFLEVPACELLAALVSEDNVPTEHGAA